MYTMVVSHGSARALFLVVMETTLTLLTIDSAQTNPLVKQEKKLFY